MSGLVALVTIGLILSVLFIALVVFAVSLWTKTKFGSEYNWKPNLSSNVLDPANLDPNLTNPWRFDQQAITFVPKTEEQLHEERHAYLRERKSYD
jgi:hypothetical protein